MSIAKIIGISIAVMSAVLIFYAVWRFFLEYKHAWRQSAAKKKQGEKTPCPLCNSKLFGNENLISRVYKTGTINDLPCTINGCPHCYPKIEAGLERTCPVCHKQVPMEGHLDAHLFTRKNGKKHVHITGCTECHKKKRP